MTAGPAHPPVDVRFEPRFCANHVVDLTAGCSFGCLYCPFAPAEAQRRGVTVPTAVDIARLPSEPAPASIFLSPASDAFAPQAAAATHAVLEHLLPRGTNVGIVTKGIVPERTVALLAEFRAQVEGVAVGVSSLDERRNRLLEPGAPPASSRLGNVVRLARRGLTVAVRLDPLFPLLDDAPAALRALVGEAAARGAYAVTATYVFLWGRILRHLRREPSLAASCELLTERAPMEGGTALSVPLARKLETYEHLHHLAGEHGLKFNTCGCKDLRIAAHASFSTTCRNAWFGTGAPAHS